MSRSRDDEEEYRKELAKFEMKRALKDIIEVFYNDIDIRLSMIKSGSAKVENLEKSLSMLAVYINKLNKGVK